MTFLIAFAILLLLFQVFILWCCLSINVTPLEKELSDKEQIRYIEEWNKKQKNKHLSKKTK